MAHPVPTIHQTFLVFMPEGKAKRTKVVEMDIFLTPLITGETRMTTKGRRK